jgi:arylsulfatase
MQVRDGFFDYNKPEAYLFNLKMDPFEKHDDFRSRDIAMKLGIAFGGQVNDILTQHFISLKMFPPRQKGASLTF